MLQITNITKQYKTGDLIQVALDDVSLNFRENEFVAILGPSGSGKTTLLNIIGGLDQYDSGDLIINGVSTKKYKDRDWDSYRNHSIGFVFQSYNLIPHQSILANVELALTISGISKSDRKQRAKDALDAVGLKDQYHKRPNQMSGGQMQRVAIARALVNNPDILLADEPTGALDSETSVQVMDLLKEVAKDRLVIMVTHNPELAEDYANRVVELKDGSIISDTHPYEIDTEGREEPKHKNLGKTSMSFLTALSLSINNLRTKKARTLLTSFAGSIGIIGIALILALSNGVNEYIETVQKDTLSTYPISIESESIDINAMMSSMMSQNASDKDDYEDGKVYSNNITTSMLSTMSAQSKKNDLAEFKKYIESDETNINDYVSAIQYGYNIDFQVYAADTEKDGVLKLNPSEILNRGTGPSMSVPGFSSMMRNSVFEEMIGSTELVSSQYDVLAGRFPDEGAHNEVVIVVDENNEISDMTLYSLGLMDQEEYKEIMNALDEGREVEEPKKAVFTYDELLDTRFKLVLNTDIYQYNETEKTWEDKEKDRAFMKDVINDALEMKVVGVIRPNPEVSASSISGTIAYTEDLTEYVIKEIQSKEIVKQQKDNPDTNVFTNLPFDIDDYVDNLTIQDIMADMETKSVEEQTQFAQLMAMMPEEQVLELMKEQIRMDNELNSSYDGNLTKLGVVDMDKPSVVNVYAKDFDSKDEISAIIEAYNTKQVDAGKEDFTITYTDIAGLMMSSISTIINMISYVLIGFVAISLVVSSIMIGIITYISVLERTKEIGILRSIGASKRNISSIFNAETLIVGLLAGVIGIGVTLLLLIPINSIIFSLSGVSNIAALPPVAGAVLIAISVVLTLIAGLIPSSKAAKQDPVTALRTD